MKKIIFIFAATITLGCSLSCHHHHEGEEHHHHDAESFTVYSNNYELFTEAEPFIAGEECDIAVHLTRLSNFKPLDSVPVTLVFINEGNETAQTLQNPDQPGIYRFHVTPTKAGHAKMKILVGGTDTLTVGHIHVVADHEALHHHDECEHHEHHHEGEHTSPTQLITFTKEQSWKIDFATEVLHKEDFGQLIEASAQITGSHGDERQIAAKTSGIVVFSNSNIAEGMAVTAGQRLFSIESDGMAEGNMGVRFQEAQNNYLAAKAEYERKQQLADDKIVSQSELLRSKTAYDNAKATYESLKNNFSSIGQQVSAPISGYIKSTATANGAYVSAGQSIITISQNRDLYVRAEVQPRHYASLSHIVGATLREPNSGNIYRLEDLDGSLVSYGHATEDNNPLIPVTFRIRNTANLVNGSFVTLAIRTHSDRQTLTIPNSGIVEEMGNHFIFVQHTPEQFEKRMVKLGATDGLRTEITEGVNEGERVVTRGATMLKLSQNSSALDPHAGHVH